MGLLSDWKNDFYKQTQDVKFLEFCEEFFSWSGKKLDTVLEARWWFYTNCKIQKYPALAANVTNDDQPLPIAFYDSYEFEHYMYFNMDKIITSSNYATYKKFLKKYIYEYDQNVSYFKNKMKTNSGQMVMYGKKRGLLKNKEYIMLLDNGERIRTANLPLLSEREYRAQYGDRLNYLFE
jgi:hypothetical protein